MVPDNASPVLKRQILFNLESNFPFVMKKEDFTVNATLVTMSSTVSPYYRQGQNTRVRRLNVVKVNDELKQLTTMFGGAFSGIYSIQIRHKNFGLLDTQHLTFTVKSEITSYSPTIGSIYGGTLLTITGTNFDPKDKLNNPVQISRNGAIGSKNCFVETTSETEITCRIEELKDSDKIDLSLEQEWKTLVFLKTSEEAACVNPLCKYTFTDDIPTITTIVKEWDL